MGPSILHRRCWSHPRSHQTGGGSILPGTFFSCSFFDAGAIFCAHTCCAHGSTRHQAIFKREYHLQHATSWPPCSHCCDDLAPRQGGGGWWVDIRTTDMAYILHPMHSISNRGSLSPTCPLWRITGDVVPQVLAGNSVRITPHSSVFFFLMRNAERKGDR